MTAKCCVRTNGDKNLSKKRRKPNSQNRANSNSNSNSAGKKPATAEAAEAVETAEVAEETAEAAEAEVAEETAGSADAAETAAEVTSAAADWLPQSGYVDAETGEYVNLDPVNTYAEQTETSPMQDVMKEHSFYAPRSSEESWDEDEEAEEETYNRSNVNRMKKAILIGLVILFLIPLILCLILFFQMSSMKKDMEQLRQDVLSKKQQMQRDVSADQSTEQLKALDREARALLEKEQKAGTITVLQQPADAGKKNGKEAAADGTEEATEAETEQPTEIDPSQVEEGKKIYLTFDDGPSPNTGKLLDVLKEKNVKATFFMVLSDRANQQVIRRMAAEGHTLGIHSASHVYSEIYADLESFKEDVQTVHDLLYEMTGQDVKYYRFPGGSSNRVSDVPVDDCIEYLEEEGYTYFDWNASNGDSSGSGYTADQLKENVLRYVYNNEEATVVLMHDFEACPETIEALPSLIDELRAEGYVFLPIDETTAPVHHRKTVKEQEENLKVEKARLEKQEKEKEERRKEQERRAAESESEGEDEGQDEE